MTLGGWRHQETEAFIEWASHYEAGDREGRSLARHQAWLWLAQLPCPVLRLDGTRPPSELVSEVRAEIRKSTRNMLGLTRSIGLETLD